MTNEERIMILEEAAEHLQKAEQLLRDSGETVLKVFIADYIDSQGQMLGKGMYQQILDQIYEIAHEGGGKT